MPNRIEPLAFAPRPAFFPTPIMARPLPPITSRPSPQDADLAARSSEAQRSQSADAKIREEFRLRDAKFHVSPNVKIMIAASIISIIGTIIIIMAVTSFREGLAGIRFPSKKSKAQAVAAWFAITPNPTYRDFRKAMNGASNVLEYYNVKKIKGPRTVEAVEAVL